MSGVRRVMSGAVAMMSARVTSGRIPCYRGVDVSALLKRASYSARTAAGISAGSGERPAAQRPGLRGRWRSVPMFQQVADPVGGSLALSALVAALPLLTLFVLLGALRWKA